VKPRLTEHLACPDCAGGLRLARERSERGEILDGELRCQGCGREFPILRGVPRLLPRALEDLAAEVADGFGWEWNRFDELRPEYRQQFLDWVRPLAPDDFRGKRVLEGGCGKGRHSSVVAEFGARDVFAVDLGSAVEAAFRNTRDAEAVHVIQGDVAHLPLKRCADVAFSVGVLHHLPDPAIGFRSLVDRLLPGGRIAVWVYGREGNEWIVDWIDPVRTRVTSRAPRRLLYEAARPLGYAVAAAAKGVYRPLTKWPQLHSRLFYKDYLTYIARLPWREIHSIVFDQLVTPVAHYLSRDEVAHWFADERLAGATIAQHNGNSWRATATRTRS
jgi:SAM-dependent methyltransferase